MTSVRWNVHAWIRTARSWYQTGMYALAVRARKSKAAQRSFAARASPHRLKLIDPTRVYSWEWVFVCLRVCLRMCIRICVYPILIRACCTVQARSYKFWRPPIKGSIHKYHDPLFRFFLTLYLGRTPTWRSIMRHEFTLYFGVMWRKFKSFSVQKIPNFQKVKNNTKSNRDGVHTNRGGCFTGR